MTNKSVWTRLRKVALSQIILISVQLFLGAMVLAAASVQEDPESTLNTFGQVATLIFVAFCVPALPVLLSATVLIRSREKVSDHIDCVLGMIHWVLVNRYTKGAVKNV